MQQDTINRQKTFEALSNLATQVSHDIRSPLAALEEVLHDVSTLPSEKRTLVHAAASRIREIANELLTYQKNAPKPDAKGAPLTSVADLLTPILAEKRAQYQSRKEIEFQTYITADAANLMLRVPRGDFARVISNLVNNAFEATSAGIIHIGVDSSVDKISISLKDSGRGIPSEVKKELGKSKISHGKSGQDSGSGLGVFHAQECVRAWGGELEIESEVGHGTTVTLKLPRVAEGAAGREEGQEAVLIDDDLSMHTLWKIAARRTGKRLRCFSSAKAMLEAADEIPRTAEVYVDESLGEGEPSGVEFAKILYERGYRNLSLATGSPKEKFSPMSWIKAIGGKTPPWT